MSNELFNRRAVVTVGKNKLTGKRYDGFRISFEVEKTSESSPNPAQISIYNLQKSTRSALEDKDLICLLEVGYSGLGATPLTSLAFVGDVRRTITKRQGADVVTTLEAGDAELALRGVHVEEAHAEFTPASTIIKGLAAKMGVSIGTIVPTIAKVFQNGISLSGLVSDQLDTLTKQAGLEWHITDGELNILDPKFPTAEPAVLVSKDTGLIGFPSKTLQGIVQFVSLINPAIKPGRAIALKSDTINGLFRARTCRLRGDTNQGPWEVAVEAY